MSHLGQWAIKDPDEIKDYSLTWPTGLTDQLISSAWAISPDDTLIKQSDSFDPSGKTTIWLAGGTVGTTYQITNHIMTVSNRTYEETVKLKCKEK